MLIRNGPVDYKIWCVMQQCVYRTKICDIYDLQNAWRKLRLTLNRTLSWLWLTSGMTIWDHVCVVVADTLNTCCKIVIYLYCVVHQNIFTARRSYASAVLGVVILSVCHTRALWLIQRTYQRCFYTIRKGNPSSFLMPKISAKFQRSHPQWGAPNRGVVV